MFSLDFSLTAAFDPRASTELSRGPQAEGRPQTPSRARSASLRVDFAEGDH